MDIEPELSNLRSPDRFSPTSRRQSDRDIADFFANANIGMHWVGPDGTILWANRYEMNLLGYSSEEYIGRHIADFHADKEKAATFLQRLHNNEIVDDEEVQLIRKDGSICYGILSESVFWEDGKFIHTRCFTRDITDRKKVEEALREKERELQSITDTVPALLAFIDREYRYQFNNAAYFEWFNEHPDDIEGKHISEITGSAIFKEVQPYIDRALGGDQTAYETTITLKDGRRRYVSGVYTPRFNHRGEIVGVVSIVNDITAHKESEQRIFESERRFHTLADTAPVMIWTAGLDKRRDYFNKYWLEFTGKPMKDEVGFGWVGTVHPDDQDRVLKTYIDFIDTRRSFRMEYRLRRHDGTYRWVLSQGVPRFTDDGNFMGYIGSVIDINDRKQFENRMSFLAQASGILYASLDYETTLQSLADLMVPSFADWCMVCLLEGNRIKTVAVAHRDPEKVAWVRQFSDRYEPKLNAPYGMGKVIRTGQSEMVPEISEQMIVAAAEDRDHLQLLRELKMTSAIIVPLKVQGKILGAATFLQAESSRRYSSEDLLFAEEIAQNTANAIENARLYQRMRESDNAKTQFLSMLAHELRNPMAPILSSLDLLNFHAENNSELQQTTELMGRQVRQMSRLLDDLLDVSRIIHGKIQLTKKDFDLNTVIQFALETTRGLKEEFGHTLSVSLPSRPVYIHADPVRIEQIIVNLLNNAYKYTEPRGTVWLTVTEQNSEAVIRIKDTGIGISPQMLPKIFELFSQADNTLSRSYGGMGIGLTLVKNLVQMHGGTVTANSAGLGTGSEFVIRLPIETASAQPQPQANFGFEGNGSPHSPTPQPSRPAQRILVVDDNKDAAHALGRLLQKIGHEVAYAYDGPSAVTTALNYQPGIILLDIGLPEMDGYEVAQRIRKTSMLQGVLLVAISGYGQEEDKIRSEEAGFDYHFTKPIGLDTLTKIL